LSLAAPAPGSPSDRWHARLAGLTGDPAILTTGAGSKHLVDLDSKKDAATLRPPHRRDQSRALMG
jgi:hypothetical protein